MNRTTEISTIDTALLEFSTDPDFADGIYMDTAVQLEVETQLYTVDAIKNVIKGVVRAQKHAKRTVTGNQLTITDNVFSPELVLLLQGGEIEYSLADPTKIVRYTPPVVGSNERGVVFHTRAWSAVYDEAGLLVQYERITYPNCQGSPISLSSQDDVFRVQNYTIDSAPTRGQAPYVIEYLDEVPPHVAHALLPIGGGA